MRRDDRGCQSSGSRSLSEIVCSKAMRRCDKRRLEKGGAVAMRKTETEGVGLTGSRGTRENGLE